MSNCPCSIANKCSHYFHSKRAGGFFLSVLILCSLLLSSPSAEAQALQRPFTVTMPLRKALNSANLMMSPAKALDSSDILRVQQGHFHRADGERIRLIGTTLSYGSCFPDSAQAIALARRFHDLGMNCVRMRGWDYTWYLFNTGSNTTDTNFNADYLKRLDWFVYQLKSQGLYVFLNQLCFTPKRNDGVRQYDSINYNWQVRAFQFVDQDYVRAQKKFLKRLFNHVNPYTAVAYKQEPCLAFLNATDENSFAYYWNQDFKENTTNMLPQTQLRYLDSLFSLYLRTKYNTSDDAALVSLWGYGLRDTTNSIKDPGFEDLFTSPWQASINTANAQAAYISSDADKVDGARSALFKILNGGSASGDVQLLARGIKVEKGKQYVFKIWAKSPQAGRKFNVYLLRGSTPYTGYGLNAQFSLSTNWQEYSSSFRSNSDDDNTLLLIQVGGANSDVYLDKVSFREDAVQVLRSGESLAKFNISTLVANSNLSTKRILETGEFINLLQEQYYKNIRAYLRDSLSSHILVGGSAWNQNLNDTYTERNLDFSSTIGYRGNWSTPPTGSPWANHWSLQKLLNAEDRYGSTVGAFTRAKMSGKPMILCGEMMAYPSPNLNELLCFLPAYASYQDVDAYFVGDWNGTNAAPDLDSNWISAQNIWEIKGQYALQSFFPSVSQAWKKQLIQPASERIGINYNSSQRKYPKWQVNGNFLLDAADSRMAFFRRIEIDSFDAKVQSVLPHLVIPEFNAPGGLDMSSIQSDTKELLWNQTAGWLKVSTPRFISATGRLNTGIMTFDNINVEQTDQTSYASFSWLSADTNSIAQAEQSLITVSTKAHNMGAIIEGDTSLWQGWGRDGVQTQSCTMRFSIRSEFDSLTVYPLDSLAQRTSTPIVATKSASGKFTFDIDQGTTHALWYQVVQKRFINDVKDNSAEAPLQLYPQPVQHSLHLRTPEGTSGYMDLTVYDAIGNAVMHQRSLAVDVVSLDCSELSNGSYRLVLRSEGREWRSRFVVVR